VRAPFEKSSQKRAANNKGDIVVTYDIGFCCRCTSENVGKLKGSKVQKLKGPEEGFHKGSDFFWRYGSRFRERRHGQDATVWGFALYLSWREADRLRVDFFLENGCVFCV
jgi:hypothetical protein